MVSSSPPSSGFFKERSADSSAGGWMYTYTGTLIRDLLATVERAGAAAHNPSPGAELLAPPLAASDARLLKDILEAEQLPQSARLSPADRNLGLFLVVHPQLVGTLEPRNDFADAVDIHQVGAVRPPEKIRI